MAEVKDFNEESTDRSDSHSSTNLSEQVLQLFDRLSTKGPSSKTEDTDIVITSIFSDKAKTNDSASPASSSDLNSHKPLDNQKTDQIKGADVRAMGNPVDGKANETGKPVDSKPSDDRSSPNGKPNDAAKPADGTRNEARKPADGRPNDDRSSPNGKPNDAAKPTDGARHETRKPAEGKPNESPKAPDAKPRDSRPGEKPEDSKAVPPPSDSLRNRKFDKPTIDDLQRIIPGISKPKDAPKDAPKKDTPKDVEEKKEKLEKNPNHNETKKPKPQEVEVAKGPNDLSDSLGRGAQLDRGVKSDKVDVLTLPNGYKVEVRRDDVNKDGIAMITIKDKTGKQTGDLRISKDDPPVANVNDGKDKTVIKVAPNGQIDSVRWNGKVYKFVPTKLD